MKKSNLLCAALLLVFVGACEAEEEPAATPLLPLPTEPDASPDSSEGDALAADVGDTVTLEDTATPDDTVVGEDTVGEDQVSVDDTAADAAEDGGSTEDAVQDAAEEDVVEEDIFVPAISEQACTVAGNPGAVKFGDTDAQTDVLVSAATTCQKSGVMEGEPWFECVRAYIIDIYGSTEDCAQCFAIRADCLKNFCFMDCIMSGSSTGTDCATCQTENYCLHPFETCTGLTVF
mgnify:CR=1 FL=1